MKSYKDGKRNRNDKRIKDVINSYSDCSISDLFRILLTKEVVFVTKQSCFMENCIKGIRTAK